jgi:arginyl-tRNA synthetase
MKSREGTVVDADDMIAEMVRLAKEQTEEAGKTEGFTEAELEHLYNMVGLGALKFYLLRVEPKKKMIFDPKESIDLHGFTATYIQYAHARICSILRKNDIAYGPVSIGKDPLLQLEKDLLLQIEQYPAMLQQAAEEFNPASLCNYAFRLSQTFNSFFAQHSVKDAESEEKKQLRLMLATMTANTLQNAMSLLGIEVPAKM